MNRYIPKPEDRRINRKRYSLFRPPNKITHEEIACFIKELKDTTPPGNRTKEISRFGIYNYKGKILKFEIKSYSLSSDKDSPVVDLAFICDNKIYRYNSNIVKTDDIFYLVTFTLSQDTKNRIKNGTLKTISYPGETPWK